MRSKLGVSRWPNQPFRSARAKLSAASRASQCAPVVWAEVRRPCVAGKTGVRVAGVGEKDLALVVHDDAGAGMGASRGEEERGQRHARQAGVDEHATHGQTSRSWTFFVC
jgi:hypothetical protein